MHWIKDLNHVMVFTWKQKTKEKPFIFATWGMTIFLFMLGLLTCIYMAVNQKEKLQINMPVDTIYVIDESGLQVDFEHMPQEMEPKYKNTMFEMVQILTENIRAEINAEKKSVIVSLSKTEESYDITLITGENTKLKQETLEILASDMERLVNIRKQEISEIPADKLTYVNSEIVASLTSAGEDEKGFAEQLFMGFAPLICSAFLFFMILFHGQSVAGIVSMEKTSKLLEMMMTMTNSVSLFMGKISAIASIAILQTICWIGGLLAGFVTGDMLAKHAIYSDFNNTFFYILKQIQSYDDGHMFSMSGLVIILVFMSLSFLFYCIVAGMIACFIQKPEDLPQIMSYYNLLILICLFLVAYYLSPVHKAFGIELLMRLCPVTCAFIIPGDIIMGRYSISECILYMILFTCFTIIFAFLAGIIYKNQLFHKGAGTKEKSSIH